jgi:hypothetical protein
MNPFVRIVIYDVSQRRDRNATIKIFTKSKAPTNKLQRVLRDVAGRTLATQLYAAPLQLRHASSLSRSNVSRSLRQIGGLKM